MTTKKPTIKKPATKAAKNEKTSVYFFSFYHGKTGEREVDNYEIRFTDIEKIDNIAMVKSVEAHLSKTFVNPKVINFVYLRNN